MQSPGSRLCSFAAARTGGAAPLRPQTRETKEKSTSFDVLLFGSPCWARTNDPAVNSRMLYRLS